MDILTAYALPTRTEISALNFVIKLESERSDQETRKLVEEYVLTPAVTQEIPRILQFMRDIWSRGEELGWFIHGSFGSGKSHFMSFLGMLLEDVEVAWSKPSEAIQKLAGSHRPWVREARPLVVRIHMLSARGNDALDRAVYEAFSDTLKRRGKAPFEYLHVEGILEEMRQEAEQYGDTFWQLLSQHGLLGSREDFDELAGGDLETREGLARGYLEFKKRDAASAGLNPNWAEGLQRMMRHARDQGFGGVVFFLDELLLWLSERRAEEFKRAINQLNTMVDHADGRRVLPLCVFVARQRNIKEFFPNLAHEDELHQHLDHHAKRFNLTTLADVELRHICKERVLKPRHPEEVARAVEEAISKHRKILPTLLQSGDDGYLRDVYPFHPALIEMLIDISALMQRERTALKLLYELLVVHYPTLALGKFLPVGSAFQAIFPESGIEGDQRKNDLKAIHKMYYTRFHPAMAMLEQRTRDASEENERFEDKARLLLDQLVKTVLLAEVSPRLKGPRGMTIERLVQLNEVDVPGKIDQARVATARKWLVQLSSLVPDLQIAGADKNATVSVVLQGVNFGEILERARGKVQNDHARFRTFARVLAEMLKVNPEELVKNRCVEGVSIEWRRTRRKGSIALLNVREQTAQSFRPREGEEWRILIDYPWDTENHTVEDDVQRTQEIRRKEGTFPTYCWLPHHFIPSEEDKLIQLAAAEYILSPEGQNELLSNLNPQERQQAIEQASSYAATWKGGLQATLLKVYGENARVISMFDKADSGLLNRNDLADSLRKLMHDVLDKRFPNHPSFGVAPTQQELGELFRWVNQAFQDANNRAGFSPETQNVLIHLGKPLELVNVGQSTGQLLLEGRYLKEVLQGASGGNVAWRTIDQNLEEKYGLQPAARNFFLVMLCQCYGYRAQNGRENVDVRIEAKAYGALTLQLGRLLELSEWSALRTLAQEAFGLTVEARRTLVDQDSVANQVSEEARKRHASLQKLHTRLVELTRNSELPRLSLLKEGMTHLAPLLVGGDSYDLLRKLLQSWGAGPTDWRELSQRVDAFEKVLTRLEGELRDLQRLRTLSQGTSPHQPRAREHLDRLDALLGTNSSKPPTEPELGQWLSESHRFLDGLWEAPPPAPPPPAPAPAPAPAPPSPPPQGSAPEGSPPGVKTLLGETLNPQDGDGLVHFWGKLRKELMALPPGEVEITIQIRPKAR
jgi:hypothetical protein